MKLRCIDNRGWEGMLTVGEEYECDCSYNTGCFVEIPAKNLMVFFRRDRFEGMNDASAVEH